MATPRSSQSRSLPATLPTWVSLALAVALIGSIVWAVSAQMRLGDAEARAEALVLEVDQLRQQANATSYVLSATAEAPTNANGMAFFALNGTGVITVANLEPLPEGRSYQVWYYPQPDAEPYPGATFAIDANGSGYTLIPADVGLFTDIAVSIEPEAGTTTPSGAIVLTGATGGARG